jgi:hypothetical protein
VARSSRLERFRGGDSSTGANESIPIILTIASPIPASVRAAMRKLRAPDTLAVALLLHAAGCTSSEPAGPAPPPDAAVPVVVPDGSPAADRAATTTGDAQSPPPPDAGQADAPGGACDPYAASPCGAGLKCTVLQTSTSVGFGCGSKGSKAEGASCTQLVAGMMQTGDDCADGMACFALQGETTPTCRQLCKSDGSGTACPDMAMCTLRITDLPAASFCRATPTCQLLQQTGCPAGQGCYLIPTGGVCAPAGTAAPGAACAAANDCVPGATCVVVMGTAGKCVSLCSTAPGGTPGCAATGTGGATCMDPPGGTLQPNAGICG